MSDSNQPSNLDEWRESDRRLREERAKVREVLGARSDESVVDAARRVADSHARMFEQSITLAAEGAQARATERDYRAALDASIVESTLDAVRRVVSQRDRMRKDLHEVSEERWSLRHRLEACAEEMHTMGLALDAARGTRSVVTGMLARLREMLRAPDGAGVIEAARSLINERDAALAQAAAANAAMEAMARRETQQTIAKWGNDTFGKSTALKLALRANEEMSELLSALVHDDDFVWAHSIDEAADVAILLFRFAAHMDGDLLAAVDRKMEVNRMRKWTVDERGNHVRDKDASP